jgi:ribosome-binding factor A
MNEKHKGRIEQTLRQLIAELLMRKVKDPRVTEVSIIDVEMSKDYSLARIRYNVIGGSENLEDVQRGLESCRGFVRSQIKNHLRLRIIPELVFVYDSSLDRAMALEELIQQIHEEQDQSDDGADSE